jgi:hypothetical protein
MCYLVLFLGHIKPDPGGNAYIYIYAGLICQQIFQVSISLAAYIHHISMSLDPI